jgi:hypothetical protein
MPIFVMDVEAQSLVTHFVEPKYSCLKILFPLHPLVFGHFQAEFFLSQRNAD